MEHHHAPGLSSPTSDHSKQGTQDDQPHFHLGILTSAQRYVDLPDCEVTGFAFRATNAHQGQVQGSYIQTFSTRKAVQAPQWDDQDSANLKIQLEDATARLAIIQLKLNESEIAVQQAADEQAAAEHDADLKARLKLVYDQEHRGTLLLVCRIRPPIGDELAQLQAAGEPWTGTSDCAAEGGDSRPQHTPSLLLQYNYNPARLQLTLPASISSSQQPAFNCKPKNIATPSRVQPYSSHQAETTTTKTFLHNVFVGPTEDTYPIWDNTIGPLVKNTLSQGGRTTIMAYGCTGSGKTYTMNWIGQEVAKTLFGSEFEQRFSVSATCVEIYKDNMYDLLVDDSSSSSSSSSKKTPKNMPQSGCGGQSSGSDRNNNSNTPKVRPPLGAAVLPTDATSVTVHSHEELTRILSRVAAARAAATTAKNATSSRSHAIFTLRVTTTVFTDTPTTSVAEASNYTTKGAYITLTDLAGFEREWEGKTADNSVEAHAINKGLLSLGRVLKSLAKQSSQTQKGHIPYRDHLLTMVLRPLMEQSRVCLLLTASPMSADAEATLSTLEFGKSASKAVTDAKRERSNKITPSPS